MLAEAKQFGEELGNVEIRVEAMAWRVPVFVALADIASARREESALRETAAATGTAVVHVYGRAVRLRDRAGRWSPRGGGGHGVALV